MRIVGLKELTCMPRKELTSPKISLNKIKDFFLFDDDKETIEFLKWYPIDIDDFLEDYDK